MGATEVVTLLKETLTEEEGAEKKLRTIASFFIKSAAVES
jgi:ferritin-like metal-binding protein YciE